MTSILMTILAVAFLVAFFGNALLCAKSDDWRFCYMPSSRWGKLLVYAWIAVACLSAFAHLFSAVDPLWFTIVIIGGQLIWQLKEASDKIIRIRDRRRSQSPPAHEDS